MESRTGIEVGGKKSELLSATKKSKNKKVQRAMSVWTPKKTTIAFGIKEDS